MLLRKPNPYLFALLLTAVALLCSSRQVAAFNERPWWASDWEGEQQQDASSSDTFNKGGAVLDPDYGRRSDRTTGRYDTDPIDNRYWEPPAHFNEPRPDRGDRSYLQTETPPSWSEPSLSRRTTRSLSEPRPKMHLPIKEGYSAYPNNFIEENRYRNPSYPYYGQDPLPPTTGRYSQGWRGINPYESSRTDRRRWSENANRYQRPRDRSRMDVREASPYPQEWEQVPTYGERYQSRGSMNSGRGFREQRRVQPYPNPDKYLLQSAPYPTSSYQEPNVDFERRYRYSNNSDRSPTFRDYPEQEPVYETFPGVYPSRRAVARPDPNVPYPSVSRDYPKADGSFGMEEDVSRSDRSSATQVDDNKKTSGASW